MAIGSPGRWRILQDVLEEDAGILTPDAQLQGLASLRDLSSWPHALAEDLKRHGGERLGNLTYCLSPTDGVDALPRGRIRRD